MTFWSMFVRALAVNMTVALVVIVGFIAAVLNTGIMPSAWAVYL